MIAEGIKAGSAKQAGGRKCSICSHTDVAEINRQIAKGVSFRAISCQIQGSDKMRESVRRHTENCLKLDVAALVEQKRIERAVDYHREIGEQLAFAKSLRVAAEKFLADPVTGETSLDYHADEIEVFYTDASKVVQNGGNKKEKAKLQDLLDWITAERPQIEPQKSELKRVDVRSFAIESIKVTDLVLDKIARNQGQYQRDNEQKNPQPVLSPTDQAIGMILNFIARNLHKKGVTINQMLGFVLEDVPDANEEKVIEFAREKVRELPELMGEGNG
jgi:hypothetical protein